MKKVCRDHIYNMIKIFHLPLFKKKKENMFFREESECEKLVIDLIDE